MKDKPYSHKLDASTWNAENAKTKDFEWFKMVVNDLVERGRLDKPSNKLLRDTWSEITGEIITSKKK
jgi:hypothetical protein